ncbi:MAG: hypothetical protein LC650_02275 [Actinobacteria bacterium]|nr:hypothetical protein [Actinomycetota bacterium]
MTKQQENKLNQIMWNWWHGNLADLHADTATFAKQTVKETWQKNFGIEVTRLRANREW